MADQVPTTLWERQTMRARAQADLLAVWSISISRTVPRSYYGVSYAIKNQLVASKAPYKMLFSCSSLILYGIREPIIGPFRA